MRTALLLATLPALYCAWCTADEPLDEVIVEVPHTTVETELRDYGVIHVLYRASNSTYDDITYLQRTSKIPATAAGFGVKLVITAKPSRQVRIAEVWSHPMIRRKDSPDRNGHTVLLHTVDPPDVYSFYFPFNEYSTNPTGEWSLQLFLLDREGPIGQNIELTNDPARFIAQVSKPFFEYEFEVQRE